MGISGIGSSLFIQCIPIPKTQYKLQKGWIPKGMVWSGTPTCNTDKDVCVCVCVCGCVCVSHLNGIFACLNIRLAACVSREVLYLSQR